MLGLVDISKITAEVISKRDVCVVIHSVSNCRVLGYTLWGWPPSTTNNWNVFDFCRNHKTNKSHWRECPKDSVFVGSPNICTCRLVSQQKNDTLPQTNAEMIVNTKANCSFPTYWPAILHFMCKVCRLIKPRLSQRAGAPSHNHFHFQKWPRSGYDWTQQAPLP